MAKIANGGNLDLQDVRGEAREAIKAYLLNLIAITLLSALALGTLVAFAIRHRSGPRLRYKVGAAVLTTVVIGVALVTLLPPRGTISDPQYYAFGPDIPRALQAVEAAQASTKQLDQELDAQLVGLAKYPNIAVKATGAPGYSAEAYPYPTMQGYLRQIFDAFGPHRMFWGTVISAMPCSWRQCVTMFTEELSWLGEADKPLVMGEAL